MGKTLFSTFLAAILLAGITSLPGQPISKRSVTIWRSTNAGNGQWFQIEDDGGMEPSLRGFVVAGNRTGHFSRCSFAYESNTFSGHFNDGKTVLIHYIRSSEPVVEAEHAGTTLFFIPFKAK